MKTKALHCIPLILIILTSGCSKIEDEILDQTSLYYNEQAFPGMSGEIKSFIVNSDTLFYERINNMNVFQGDIILSDDQVSGKISGKGLGLESLITRWPDNTVYYWFGSSFPYKSRVLDAINYWERNTPIRFVKSERAPSIVIFEWDNDGCFSHLGMKTTSDFVYYSQVIGIADWADVGTVIHEIGHTIGLAHEDTRPDRDQYMDVNFSNVLPDKEYNFKKVNSQFISSQFDFNSIMLNSAYFLSGNGLPTRTKKDGSGFDVQRKTLSSGDIDLVKALYSAPQIGETTTSNISDNSALIQVAVTEFGTEKISETGIFWGTSQYPEKEGNKVMLGNVATSYTFNLKGLTPNTKYYLRAYATNSLGTFYGNTKILKTMTGTVKDIEGNDYWTVTIGTQVWMAENLKTTKLNNGTLLPNVVGNYEWTLPIAAYCWYNLEPSKYGALYNLYAVNTGKLCPTGWHVSSDNDWKTLEMYLGMSQSEADISFGERGTHNEGGKLKEASTNYWYSSKGATNETGFSALPGGYRSPDPNATGLKQFYNIKSQGVWWSPASVSTDGAKIRTLNSSLNTIGISSYSSRCGLSVRCVKD